MLKDVKSMACVVHEAELKGNGSSQVSCSWKLFMLTPFSSSFLSLSCLFL